MATSANRELNSKYQLSLLLTTIVAVGLHVSRKDRKHLFEEIFYKLYRYDLVSVS